MSIIKSFCGVALVLGMFSCSSKNKPVENGADEPVSDKENEWLTMNGRQQMPYIVLVSGDEEYRSEEALPQLAKILSQRHGFKCTVLFAQNPEKPGIVNPNYLQNIPGLELLDSADLMIIFTRFRALPDEQMKHFDNYLKAGKPVIGIRTATHAFYYKGTGIESGFTNYGNSYQNDDAWKDGFGRLVLGEKWISHHGHHKHQSTTGIIVPAARDHPVVNGIEDGDIWGPSDVYGVRLPLPGDTEPIVYGQVTDRAGEYDENDPLFGMRPTDSVPAAPVIKKDKEGNQQTVDLNDPMMPIAWIKSYQVPGGKKGKAFTSTIGASTDLLAEGTRRLIVNAAFWCLENEVPPQANVDIVGEFNPSQFGFHTDSTWNKKNLKISALK